VIADCRFLISDWHNGKPNQKSAIEKSALTRPIRYREMVLTALRSASSQHTGSDRQSQFPAPIKNRKSKIENSYISVLRTANIRKSALIPRCSST
jgi:hypothetical protein